MKLDSTFIAIVILAIVGTWNGCEIISRNRDESTKLQQAFEAQRNENKLLSEKITSMGNKLQEYSTAQYAPQIIQQSPNFEPLRARLEEMEIRLKDLVSSMSVSVNVIDSSRTKLMHDTLLADGVFAFQDTSGNLKLSGTADMKNAVFDYKYQYNVALDIVTHRSRKYFWQPYETHVSVLSKDKNATISLQPIVVKEKPRRLSLGVFGGYGVLISPKGITPGPVLGGGVSYRIW